MSNPDMPKSSMTDFEIENDELEKVGDVWIPKYRAIVDDKDGENPTRIHLGRGLNGDFVIIDNQTREVTTVKTSDDNYDDPTVTIDKSAPRPIHPEHFDKDSLAAKLDITPEVLDRQLNDTNGTTFDGAVLVGKQLEYELDFGGYHFKGNNVSLYVDKETLDVKGVYVYSGTYSVLLYTFNGSKLTGILEVKGENKLDYWMKFAD